MAIQGVMILGAPFTYTVRKYPRVSGLIGSNSRDLDPTWQSGPNELGLEQIYRTKIIERIHRFELRAFRGLSLKVMEIGP